MALSDIKLPSEYTLQDFYPDLVQRTDDDGNLVWMQQGEGGLTRFKAPEDFSPTVSGEGKFWQNIIHEGYVPLSTVGGGGQQYSPETLAYFNKQYGLNLKDAADYYRYIYDQPNAQVVNDPRLGPLLSVGADAQEKKFLNYNPNPNEELLQALAYGGAAFGAAGLASGAGLLASGGGAAGTGAGAAGIETAVAGGAGAGAGAAGATVAGITPPASYWNSLASLSGDVTLPAVEVVAPAITDTAAGLTGAAAATAGTIGSQLVDDNSLWDDFFEDKGPGVTGESGYSTAQGTMQEFGPLSTSTTMIPGGADPASKGILDYLKALPAGAASLLKSLLGDGSSGSNSDLLKALLGGGGDLLKLLGGSGSLGSNLLSILAGLYGRDQAKKDIEPYAQVGKQAGDILQGLMGGSATREGMPSAPSYASFGAAPTMKEVGDVTQVPGYQQLLAQRENALSRRLAAQGYNMSGNERASLADLGGAQYNEFYNIEQAKVQKENELALKAYETESQRITQQNQLAERQYEADITKVTNANQLSVTERNAMLDRLQRLSTGGLAAQIAATTLDAGAINRILYGASGIADKVTDAFTKS